MIRRTVAVAASALLASGALAPAESQERVYVTAQDGAAVAVVDAATGALLETVDLRGLGFGPAARPHHVVVEPGGAHWYVSLIGEGVVLKMDAQNRPVGRVEMETPGMLALDPAGALLYASRSMTAVRPPPRLGMVERTSMDLEELDTFMPHPHALAVDPTGGRVFTASLGENRLAFAPLGSEDVEHVSFDGPLHMIVQLAVSPDGRWLAGGGEMSGDLLVWDISGAAPVQHARVHLGGKPWDPAFLPDGSELWIPNLTGGTVTVVDASTWTVAAEIGHPALVEPHGIAVSADGRTVFVSARNTTGAWGGEPGGALVAIDAKGRTVRWATRVGPYAAGVAVAPAPAPSR